MKKLLANKLFAKFIELIRFMNIACFLYITDMGFRQSSQKVTNKILLYKSVEWFLYDRDFCLERVIKIFRSQ